MTGEAASVELQSLRLLSCHIIEIIGEDTILWTWSYPNIEPRVRTVCLSKCKKLLVKSNPKEPKETTGVFHIGNQWFYVFLETLLSGGKEEGIGLIISADTFHPELYTKVASVLYLTYVKTGKDASAVLQQFLSLLVDGMCLLPKKKAFKLGEYEDLSRHDQHQIKEMISTFGLETIVMYTGFWKRKRIVVYHYDVEALKNFILSIPVLCCCDEIEAAWNSLYPLVDLNEDEISLMQEKSFYVMGCPNASVENRTDLYDIFVNVPAAEISIGSHARESVTMNKTHKEMATFMVQLADAESTEENVVKELKKRHQEVKGKLGILDVIN